MRIHLRQVGAEGGISKFWGSAKLAVSQAGTYITFLNLFMLSITTYSSPWLHSHFDISFWIFESIIFGAILVFLLIVFFVDMPSFFSQWNSQFWQHNNPLRKAVEDLQEQNKDIRRQLDDQIQLIRTLTYELAQEQTKKERMH